MSLKKVKIVRKQPIGIKPVYDISVPGAHHYLLDSGVVSHNSGFIYASSIVVAMQKLKLKEDESGNKVSDVRGIRAKCKVMKTRYSKPFEDVTVKIPWETGMNPYSGLLDLFEKKGVLAKTGNKYVYIDKETGEELKYFRKGWESNEGGCLDTVMQQWDHTSDMGIVDDDELDQTDLDTEFESIDE